MTQIVDRHPEETLREALSSFAKQAPMTLKRQAELLGIAESTFANSINPHISDVHYHLRHLIPHTLLLQDFTLLDYLESCVGRVAFQVPDAPEHISDLPAELAALLKRFGELVLATGTALEDGRVQRNDVKRIEREVNDLVRQLMAYLKAVKARMERF